ncbi:MAG: YbaB/EbfC family nucleoid-associated protein [Planctomycetes bacterium]|nr:YbaB/EbfC family nucleoid-associated protein [Planctomycetota bacterium]
MTGSGSFGDMGNLLKQAQQMQRELDRAREELRTTVVTGTSGGGAVRMDATGEGMIVRVSIRADAATSGDAAMLEDLVLAAARDAITKANELRQDRMGRVTGGLNLPGIL